MSHGSLGAHALLNAATTPALVAALTISARRAAWIDESSRESNRRPLHPACERPRIVRLHDQVAAGLEACAGLARRRRGSSCANLSRIGGLTVDGRPSPPPPPPFDRFGWDGLVIKRGQRNCPTSPLELGAPAGAARCPSPTRPRGRCAERARRHLVAGDGRRTPEPRPRRQACKPCRGSSPLGQLRSPRGCARSHKGHRRLVPPLRLRRSMIRQLALGWFSTLGLF